MSFVSDDIGEFEETVRQLFTEIEASPDTAPERLADAFRELGAEDTELGEDEVSRRASRVAFGLPEEPRILRAIAIAAREASIVVRGAVVGRLPAEFQGAVYAAASPAAVAGVSDGDLDPSVKRRPGGGTNDPATSRVAASEFPDEWRTVWLLGARDEVETNAQMLASQNLEDIKVPSLGHLKNMEGESCCGIVIHRSWWQLFEDADERVAFLRDQLNAFNIPHYRVDSDGLGDGGQVKLAAALATYDAATRSRVQISAGAAVTEIDCWEFLETARVISSADRAGVGLEGLTAGEHRLLVTAIALFDAEERQIAVSTVNDLLMWPLVDGRSGARVFRLKQASGSAVYVAKLDEIGLLRKEIAQAKAVAPFLVPQMKFYSLGGSGVLVQRLAESMDTPLEGAPSLKERLGTRSGWERGGSSIAEPRIDDLKTGMDRLVQMIKGLNVESSGEIDCSCWTKVEPLDALSALGIEWSIETEAGLFNPRELVPWVEGKVAEQGSHCLVHGDLHAGNVLMVDDRTPRLIDFALAGSGHPCFDLVRMSSAIAYSAIRAVVPENRLRELFKRVHVDGEEEASLAVAFSDVIGSSSGAVALHALGLARTAAIELLEGVVDAPLEHYLAMVYLIAAQSLTMDEFQGLAVRAALGAIQPELVRLACEAD